MSDVSHKTRSAVALILLLPAPSLGVLFGMILLPDTALGKAFFAASKVWILALPLVWRIFVERRPPSLSPPRNGGFLPAAALGLFIVAAIVLAWFTLSRALIDPAQVRDLAVRVGLADRTVYLLGALYWITVNSLLEEYVWRWFVVEKARDFAPAPVAVLISAAGFTLHHIIAMQTYFNALTTALAASGIFIGGALWAILYLRYKSIWPPYLSHALVDIPIFAIGYYIIFY